MKTAFKIIGIIAATFILVVVLAITLTRDDKQIEISPTKQLSEAEIHISDSIKVAMKKSKDSLMAQKEIARAAEAERAFKKLKTFRNKTDEFDGSSFYQHPQTPKYVNQNFIYPYIGKKSDNYWLRLKFQYAADSWLFIERVKIKTDTEQYELSGSFKRDNHSEIWEWADIKAERSEYFMLRDMASSKDVLIRYEGRQYHKDRKLTTKEKTVISETLDVFDGIDAK